MTVKDNEVAGRTIEQMIASKIAEETHAEPIFTSGAAFYDFVLNELKVDWSTVQALLTDKRKGVCSRANGEKGVNYNLIFKGDCQ